MVTESKTAMEEFPVPRISVAVITYNHERFIAQALDSILNQDLEEPLEIVVGEDCSSDRTAAIVLDYARRYPDRVRPLIRQQNTGSGGRNLEATIHACRGRYIATLEGDDFWLTRDKLRRQVEFLDQHPEYAACYSNTITTNEDGIISSVRMRPEPDRSYDLRDVLEVKKGSNVALRSLIFRREAFPGFPQWVWRQKMADKAMSVLLARHGKMMRFGQPLAVHRYHGGGVWTNLSLLKQRFYQVRHMRALHHWIDTAWKPLVAAQLTKARLRLGLALLSNGRWSRGWRYLGACARRAPRPGVSLWMRLMTEAIWIGIKRCCASAARRWAGKVWRRRIQAATSVSQPAERSSTLV